MTDRVEHELHYLFATAGPEATRRAFEAVSAEYADASSNRADDDNLLADKRRFVPDATRNRVLTEHAYAIRHLLDHYYGPVPYEQAADIAISQLAEAMGDE